MKNEPSPQDSERVIVKALCWVFLRQVGELENQSTKYLFVPQTNPNLDIPQIEEHSRLGQAISGKFSDKNSPINYEDRIKGIVGIYLLEVRPFS